MAPVKGGRYESSDLDGLRRGGGAAAPGSGEAVAEGENEVLVRVAAAQVSAGDCEMRSLKLHFPYRLPMRLYVGVRRPQRVTVLGQDLSGEVEAVGSAVTALQAR